jgi:hypothetical protein
MTTGPHPRSSRRWHWPALLASMLAAVSAHADTEYSADAVKAAYLFRFAGYVDWPPSATPGSAFTIAVLCANGVADELDRIVAGRSIKGLPVETRRLKSLQQIDQAQIVYVGAGCYLDLHDRLAPLARRPVLLVTDDQGALRDGATINFLSIDNHVRFEISLQSAERSGLKISSELLSVAARVLGIQLRSNFACSPRWAEAPSSDCRSNRLASR